MGTATPCLLRWQATLVRRGFLGFAWGATLAGSSRTSAKLPRQLFGQTHLTVASSPTFSLTSKANGHCDHEQTHHPARTLLAAIIIAAVAKMAGFDIGLDCALQFIMETS